METIKINKSEREPKQIDIRVNEVTFIKEESNDPLYITFEVKILAPVKVLQSLITHKEYLELDYFNKIIEHRI